MRPFDLQSQRSDAGERSRASRSCRGLEIPREPATASAFTNARRRARRGLGGARVSRGRRRRPELGFALAYDARATLLDYLRPRALVVLEEPGMLATIDRSLDEERSREEAVLLAGVESGELDVRDDEVGEALVAELSAPYPRSPRAS